jgi:large subunit ribosomal protein L11
MLSVKNIIFIFVRSQLADSGPPLGTVLGNLGINAVKFCKDFNEFTKDLPSYFLLKVKILIFEDRSYNFFINPPTTGFLLMFVKVQQTLDISRSKKGLNNFISLKNVVQIARFKFPYLDLRFSMAIVLGSLNSCNLKILC